MNGSVLEVLKLCYQYNLKLTMIIIYSILIKKLSIMVTKKNNLKGIK